MAGSAYSKEQLALLLEGVSRIFNGFIVELVLGVIFAIAYVTVILASFGNVESLIQGFGILFVILGLLFIPIYYYFFYGGLVYLSKVDRNKYGIGVWGSLGLLALGVVLVAYGIYLAVSRPSWSMFLVMAVPITIVGLIFQVLIYIALYRLGNDFGIDYLTAGIIILIVAAVIYAIPAINVAGGVLALVGLILMLVGLNEVKKKIEAMIISK